jgi:hypothetical protein
MAEKNSENVEVGFDGIDVIGSTGTVTNQERKFQITNGDKEIIATVMGSDDNLEWRPRESKNISANSSDEIDLDYNHNVYIKLVARTTIFGDTSMVDTTFTYTPQ